ncbi:hypothetical protein ACFL0W_00865 [Nanoarchaeota archaeon]
MVGVDQVETIGKLVIANPYSVQLSSLSFFNHFTKKMPELFPGLEVLAAENPEKVAELISTEEETPALFLFLNDQLSSYRDSFSGEGDLTEALGPYLNNGYAQLIFCDHPDALNSLGYDMEDTKRSYDNKYLWQIVSDITGMPEPSGKNFEEDRSRVRYHPSNRIGNTDKWNIGEFDSFGVQRMFEDFLIGYIAHKLKEQVDGAPESGRTIGRNVNFTIAGLPEEQEKQAPDTYDTMTNLARATDFADCFGKGLSARARQRMLSVIDTRLGSPVGALNLAIIPYGGEGSHRINPKYEF